MYGRLCPGVPLSNVSRTHVRYWVIVFAVTLAVITYVDRTIEIWLVRLPGA